MGLGFFLKISNETNNTPLQNGNKKVTVKEAYLPPSKAHSYSHTTGH